MRPETEEKLRKIKKISKVSQVICKVMLAILACVSLAGIVGIVHGRGVTLNISGVRLPMTSLSLGARIVVAVFVVLSMGVGIKGLYHLHRLFGNYGNGNIFTTDSANQIRQLGIAALLWFFVSILWMVAALVFVDPMITSISCRPDALIVGLVVIVISWFMEMAAEMREENELTV